MEYEQLLNSQIHNISNVYRYSGKILIKQESVADHVINMISIALLLVPELNKLSDNRIDIKDVIYRCSVHDLDESLSLDIPRPYKYHNREILNAIENTNNILLKENYEDSIVEDIKNAKDPSILEGFIVKYLDHIQTWFKLRQEILLGNRLIRTELVNIIGVFDELKDLVGNNEKLNEDQRKLLIMYLDESLLDIDKYSKL